MATISTLSNEQIQSFDFDFVSDCLFGSIAGCIERDFPSGEFTFLDVGGGSGGFSDRLLERFPSAHGVLLDNAEDLLRSNRLQPRKTLVHGSVEDVVKLTAGTPFDIVFLNLSLHHFVTRSYRATRRVQRAALEQCVKVLAEGGRVSIIENLCDGVFPHLSGRMVFALTSSRPLAPLIRRLGAHTAGCGVCFLDRDEWCGLIAQAGLDVLHFEAEPYEGQQSRLKRILLLIRDIRAGHFWSKRASHVPAAAAPLTAKTLTWEAPAWAEMTTLNGA